MKKLTYLFSILGLLLAFTGNGMAQAPAPKPGAATASTAKPGTSQNVHLNAIWEYDKQLKLSADQVSKIKAAVKGLQDSLNLQGAKQRVGEIELANLINKNADPKDIKAKLTELAGIQVEMRFADIDTARQVNTILTPDQLKQWRSIQAKTRSQPAPAPKGK